MIFITVKCLGDRWIWHMGQAAWMPGNGGGCRFSCQGMIKHKTPQLANESAQRMKAGLEREGVKQIKLTLADIPKKEVEVVEVEGKLPRLGVKTGFRFTIVAQEVN